MAVLLAVGVNSLNQSYCQCVATHTRRIEELQGKIELAVRDLAEMQREGFACDSKLYVAQIEKYLAAALTDEGGGEG